MRVTDEDIRRAMRPKDADRPVPPDRVPPILYHVTPIGNLDAILAEGLIPRTRNLIEEHPPRVYLCGSPASAFSLCRQIRGAMVDRRAVRRTWIEDFAILAVDVAEAGVGLRVDGSSLRERGVYAEEAIAPGAIRHVETVDGLALTTTWWPKVWNHVIRARGARPTCLGKLGAITGLPHYDGWRDPMDPRKAVEVDRAGAAAPRPA